MSVKPRARYTLEFKLEAVRLVKAGQSMGTTTKVLGSLSRHFTTGSNGIARVSSTVLEPSR
jgi:transposase-like protein